MYSFYDNQFYNILISYDYDYRFNSEETNFTIDKNLINNYFIEGSAVDTALLTNNQIEVSNYKQENAGYKNYILTGIRNVNDDQVNGILVSIILLIFFMIMR